jgi:hypothetical protein
MADYKTLISRAVARLEKDTAEARRAIYHRARIALFEALRGVTPPLSQHDIAQECLKFEEAIGRVEAESVRRYERAEESDPLAQLARLIGQEAEAKLLEEKAPCQLKCKRR